MRDAGLGQHGPVKATNASSACAASIGTRNNAAKIGIACNRMRLRGIRKQYIEAAHKVRVSLQVFVSIGFF